MKLFAIALIIGATTCVFANTAEVSSNHLEARDPTLGIISGIIGGVLGGGSKPASNWQCSGSGDDGWSVDYNGKSKPSWCPTGWKWFGSNIGWAPPKGFSVSASFQFPSLWLPVAHKCTWFVPSTAWKTANVAIDLGIAIPSFWNLRPQPDWNCNGDGSGGWNVDEFGHGRPSGYPSSWLYFGKDYGWGMPKGFQVDVNFRFPSLFLAKASLFKWFVPSREWANAHRNEDFPYPLPDFWNCEPDAPEPPPEEEPTEEEHQPEPTDNGPTTVTVTQVVYPTDCNEPPHRLIRRNKQRMSFH